MRFVVQYEIGFCVFTVLLLSGCQPVDDSHTRDTPTSVKKPTDIRTDSITIKLEDILNVKPSRYQPSLSLQGVTEPIKRVKLVSTRALTIEQVLVSEGQAVDKDTPLLIVRHQVIPNEQTRPLASKTSSETIRQTALIQQGNQAVNGTNSVIRHTDQTLTIRPNSPLGIDTTGLKQPRPSAANPLPSTNAPTLQNTKDVKITGNKQTPKQGQASQDFDRVTEMVTVRANFSGHIHNLSVQAGQKIPTRTPLLQISDDADLRFIATLPKALEPQLSVGQTVDFTINGLSDEFTGQISELITDDKTNQLLVSVHVPKSNATLPQLAPKMTVTGRVNYGQIEVGATVPESALHGVDLTTIQKPPYQSLMPLKGTVWIIQQNQRLLRQAVNVISYDPNTKQYLITGISNDSLICLMDLPITAMGKKAVVS